MVLDEAKAKFESAQSEGDWHEGQRLAQEVVRLAGAELAAARRKNDTPTKLGALELVVQANMFLGDSIAASLAANDEVAMIHRSGDKAAEAKALQLLAEVQVSRGDTMGSVDSLRSAVALGREVGDSQVLASSLRALSLALLAANKKHDALAPAQESLKLFGGLNDPDGEARARRAVNSIFVELGQLDKAPDRSAALSALKDLAAAVSSRNTAQWTAAMQELNKTCAYCQKDVDDVIQEALEKDRPIVSVFLEEQGVETKGSGLPQTVMKEVPKQIHYLNFRLGGLGYGPRFRCVNSYKKQIGEDLDTLAALGCLQIAEEAEDWEAELQFHPGVLDSMLQSGNAYYA
mmetsp:Transcript_34237/g.72939  ORF Transcript_34237/g.72939 Transcript_34237/m.72939 type:complete len:347 (-) Transcript_34237:151-1191(-)|eukprot:CAMPEP_0206464444 /NCGR_PEP_ID=MMETSP0324_2-20121206/27222_1 /ASSEMBLY_ACC=CAM_ASM_000836 /TAXON_ID=2866 /ORGANISM="Crypthecodinium cohnii, Strain Seligo" /LENGTH=346 /DNA_ID=CAMNT_0053937081 /DNA_START=160 /DNA_END=1200 /DNA_ORIENTATION=+